MENQDGSSKGKVRINKRILKAFEMKFDGKSYEEIANETKYKYNYIMKQFSIAGTWLPYYDKYREEITEQIIKDTRFKYKKHMDKASDVMIATMAFLKSDPRVAQEAAKDILDRGGMKPVQEISVKEKVLTVAEELAAELEEQKKQNQDDK